MKDILPGFMKTITLQTSQRSEFVNITAEVQAAVLEIGAARGAIIVFVPHTTAGVTINENADPDVMSDIKTALDSLVPWEGPYRHGEGNSAAHVKASLMGASVQVAIDQGQLQLGTWQGIFFCEFDGPRRRSVRIFRA